MNKENLGHVVGAFIFALAMVIMFYKHHWESKLVPMDDSPKKAHRVEATYATARIEEQLIESLSL